MSRSEGRYRRLRRIFVDFCRAAFLDDPEFSHVVNDEQIDGKTVAVPDHAASKLLVFDSWASSDDFPEKKPRLIVSREGSVAGSPVGIGHRKGFDLMTGDRSVAQLRTTTVTINCVAASDLVTDDIASEVEVRILAALDNFKAKGVVVQDTRVGDIFKLDAQSVLPRWFVTPVHVTVVFWHSADWKNENSVEVSTLNFTQNVSQR